MAATAENIGRRNISLGCGVVLGLFALILSGTILVFDGYLGWSAYRQIRAQNYPTTAGAVTHSEVEGHGGRHSNYSPNVLYKYAVAGKTYSSNRYRFGDVYAVEGKAHQIVGEHPVGKQVRVYYNPDDPADALLQPGVDGGDLFLATFLLPFNLLVVVIGSLLAGKVWRGSAKAPAGGAKLWDDGFQVRVRVSQTRPFVVAAVVAGLLAFGSLFVALGFGGPHPPMALMVAAWCVILVGGLLGYMTRKPAWTRPSGSRRRQNGSSACYHLTKPPSSEGCGRSSRPGRRPRPGTLRRWTASNRCCTTI
jgi:hypothetical protein